MIQKSENKELLGKNIHDSAKVNQVIGTLQDLRTAILALFFDKDYQSKLK